MPHAPWMAHYGDMPASLTYPDTTMYQQLIATADRYGDKPAYVFMGKTTCYSQLIRRISRAAGIFSSLGIQAGDRVSICLPNVPQAIDAFYGLNALGAIACMIHPLSAPEEIAYYLNLTQSKLIITLDMLYEKVASVTATLNQACPIVVTTIQEELPSIKRLLYPLVQKQSKIPMDHDVLQWRQLIQTCSCVHTATGSPDDCAAILFSGGTTGMPKGICLSNRNFNALALQTIAASGCDSIVGLKMLSVMPMFHGFGLGIGIHTPLVGGGCCLLIPRFTVDSYAKLVKTQKPNFIPGVPTLFAALLQAKALQKADLSFLKGVFSGGDSLSPDLKKRVDAFLKERHSPVTIREGYGTTECVTASCLTPVHRQKEGSIGIPFADTFYKIVKPDTTEDLPSQTEGEICIAGPSVMLGYWNDQEETRRVLKLHPDGQIWLHTGDLGMMDEDGYVYFRQRLKRMIVTNGYNVYPTQIEKVLSEHPAVNACCVIGLPDPMRGQRVRAYVVAKSAVTEEELFQHCRRYIAKYALPKEMVFKTELPKTAVGKIAYRVLEEEAKHEIETGSHC